MDSLAAHLRAMQLYAHACHNVVSGPHFLPYHGLFGELYPAYETDYDNVVERSIGLGEAIDIRVVTAKAFQAFAKENFQLQDAQHMFQTILKMEKELCALVAGDYKKASPGTQQMLGTIADLSEIRQYKLKQLMKAKG